MRIISSLSLFFFVQPPTESLENISKSLQSNDGRVSVHSKKQKFVPLFSEAGESKSVAKLPGKIVL